MKGNSNVQSESRYDPEDFDRALEILKKGGVILYPTDTVWGIGCDATNAEAVKRVFEIKERCDSKSMLSLVGSERELERWVQDVPEAAWMLIDAAVKPLTIIYDSPHGIAKSLLAEDGSAGIRITRESFSRNLCSRLKRPIVSTSANIAGRKTPRNFSDISPEILEAVDYVVKYRQGECGCSRPSNVIKVGNNGTIKIIR